MFGSGVNRNGMRYMWKFFLLLMLVVTSCSEKQIDGNVINVAEAMSRLSEGQSVQNLFSSISYIPLETNEQAIIGKYPECIIMDSAILVSSVHQNLKLFDRTIRIEFDCKIQSIVFCPKITI